MVAAVLAWHLGEEEAAAAEAAVKVVGLVEPLKVESVFRGVACRNSEQRKRELSKMLSPRFSYCKC